MPGFDNNTVYADNVDFRGVSPVAPQIVSDGQLLIGSTAAPHIRAGILTSTDLSITITRGAGTIDLSASGGGGPTIAFSAYLGTNTGTTETGDGTFAVVPIDTVLFDTNSAFNTGTFSYIIPATGIYQFTSSIYFYRLAGANTVTLCYFSINGTPTPRMYELNFENIQIYGEVTLNFSDIFSLTSGDAVQIGGIVGGASKNIGYGQSVSTFSGFKIA